MITNTPIIIEERLAEMFAYLPEMKSNAGATFKPTFMYGDDKQLLDFLRQKSKGKSVYPLIWMIYPTAETHNRSNVSFDNLTLVLAVETNSVMLNQQRIKETYTNYLMPLFGNIKACFMQANISNVTDSFVVTKHPNYSQADLETENKATYIWDALTITISGNLNSNCLQPIEF